jgi:ADP-ribose pyrophosphatase
MTLIPVFCGEVSHSGETSKEYSEAILENPAFSKEELKQGFARGYIEVPIKGEVVKVNCRDPFLTYAILQAEMKGLL